MLPTSFFWLPHPLKTPNSPKIILYRASEYESSEELFEQSQTINDEEKESLLYFKEDSGEHAVQQSKWRRFIAWLKVESAHSWKERVLEYLRRLFLLLHSLTVLGLGYHTNDIAITYRPQVRRWSISSAD